MSPTITSRIHARKSDIIDAIDEILREDDVCCVAPEGVCDDIFDGCNTCGPSPVRLFKSGATRDTNEGKYDYDGFLSPIVLEAFAAYMHTHRVRSDGTLRDSDDWKKGMPAEECLKSLHRHFMDLWLLYDQGCTYRPESGDVSLEDAYGGLFFNLQILWHQFLMGDDEIPLRSDGP